jgi:hypothetical protein
LQKLAEHSRKTADSLPWKINISEKLTLDAGLPSNEKKYDLFGEYIFFLDADGKICYQQGPNCADFDSANAKGVNITGMMSGPMKYLTEELEQKIKDYFSKIEAQFYLGKREIGEGREKIIGESEGLYNVDEEQRFVTFRLANHSDRDMSDVELVIRSPVKQGKVSDAVGIIFAESSGIERVYDACRLKVGTLPAGKEAVMNLEFIISYTDRFLEFVGEVTANGGRYGRYQILLQVNREKDN